MEVSAQGAPIPEVRPREVILNDIREIERQQEELGPKIDTLVATIPQDKLRQLEQAVQRRETGELGVEEAKDKFSEDPQAQEYIGLYEQARSIYLREGQLHREYVDYKREDVAKLIKNLSARMDYTAVLAALDKKFPQSSDDIPGNIFGDLFILRRAEVSILTGAIQASDYQALDFTERTLKEFGEKWEKRGFLKSEPDPNHGFAADFGEPVRERRERILKNIDITLAHFRRYKQLSDIYSLGTTLDANLDSVIVNLKDGLNIERGYKPEGLDKLDHDPRLLDAVEAYMDKRLGELALEGKYPQNPEQKRKYLERLQNLSFEEVTADLKVETSYLKDGSDLILTNEGLFIHLKDNLPPAFLRKLDTISLKSSGPLASQDDESKLMAAQLIRYYNPLTNELVSTRIEVYRDHTVPQGIEEAERHARIFLFLGALYHEIGHNAHFQISYDEMEEWEKTMVEEPQHVSWYEKYAREKNEDYGKREAWSDAFKLYCIAPAVLQTVAPLKYLHMRKFFMEHMPQDRAQPYDLWKLHMMSEITKVWKEKEITKEKIVASFVDNTQL